MSLVIDADTHILESSAVWNLICPDMYPRRPILLTVPGDTLYGARNAFWLIDGNIVPKPGGKGGFLLHTPSEADFEQARTDTSVASRELIDVEARLHDMDRLSVSIQIIYPTIFLEYLTHDVALEVALCEAYNRWMATVWSKAKERIRWITVLPLRDIEASLAQIQEAKQHGAVGVFFRGIEGERTLDEPYFFPIYEAASQLDMPICIHIGRGCYTLAHLFNFGHGEFVPEPVKAFRDLIAQRVPERFPYLRFGFIEAGSSWVPYSLHRLKRQAYSSGRLGFNSSVNEVRGQDWGPALFRDYRLYVACQADEDLPYLLGHIGEDNLIIGSDYGHIDQSFEAGLVSTMRARDDIPSAVTDKILGSNAKVFYGI